MKPPVDGFKPVQDFQQLKPGIAQLGASRTELFHVPDCESDSVNCDAYLVRHLEFDCRWSGHGVGLDRGYDLMHYLGTHTLYPTTSSSKLERGIHALGNIETNNKAGLRLTKKGAAEPLEGAVETHLAQGTESIDNGSHRRIMQFATASRFLLASVDVEVANSEKDCPLVPKSAKRVGALLIRKMRLIGLLRFSAETASSP